MNQFDVVMRRIPLRDQATADMVLTDLGNQGYQVVYATSVMNDVVVFMQRERVAKAQVAEKKKEAKKKVAKKKETKKKLEE